MHVDIVLRWGSFWVGCHYSERHKSCCIALIPGVVLRVSKTPYDNPERSGRMFHVWTKKER